MTINQTLGANIRAARMRSGLSQYGVGQRVNRSRAAVASIEAGRQSVTCDQLIEFSEVLNVDFRTLLEGVVPSIPRPNPLDRLPPEQRRWIQVLKEKTMSTPSVPPPPSPGTYEHYKGGRYRLLMTAQHSETQELMAIYVSLDGTGTVWARPISMWTEEVKTVGGSVRPRFQAIEEDVMRVSISSNLASE